MRTRALVLAALACLLPGCGGDSSSTTTPVTQPPAPTVGTFSATVNPNPIIAADCTPAVCGNQGFQFAAIGTVVITETTGLGGNVDFINLTLRSGATGAEIGTINLGATQIVANAGTNHINGRATLSVPNVGLIYRLAGGSRQGTMTYAIRVTDDRGTIHNLVINVSVV